MENDSVFGHLTVASHNGDCAYANIKTDRLGLDQHDRLLFASVLADAGYIKGLRAILNSDKRVTISASEIRVKKASQNDNWSKRPGTIVKLEGGYSTLIHRMGYGMTHALFLTRSPGFLVNLTDDHLWYAFMQPTYTTPMLRPWVPYLRRRLAEKGLLREAHAYRCECATLDATTADLDVIVTEGLRDREISIPDHDLAIVA